MSGHISHDEFKRGIVLLQRIATQSSDASWSKTRIVQHAGDAGLRITHPRLKTRHSSNGSNGRDTRLQDEVEDDDLEALHDPLRLLRPSSPEPDNCDVIWSPLWRVPVLYVDSIHVAENLAIAPSMHIHEQARPVLCVTDHPWRNLPVLHAHPCRTADMMQEIMGGVELSPVRYVLAWLGLIGFAVGMTVPLDIAQAEMLSA